MNRCSKSGIHEHSQIAQFTSNSSMVFFHIFPWPWRSRLPYIMGCLWRYLEIMVPCRICILLSFLINWRTGSVCKGLPPSFTVLGNGFLRNYCRSLLNLLLLDATGFPAAFPLTRQGMHPLVALEKSTLRRICRVSPKLLPSPDF